MSDVSLSVVFFAIVCIIVFSLAKYDFQKKEVSALSAVILFLFIFASLLLYYQDNRTHFWSIDTNVPYEVIACDEKKEKCLLRNVIGEIKFYNPKNSTESYVGMTFTKKDKGEYEEKRTLPPSKR